MNKYYICKMTSLELFEQIIMLLCLIENILKEKSCDINYVINFYSIVCRS